MDQATDNVHGLVGFGPTVVPASRKEEERVDNDSARTAATGTRRGGGFPGRVRPDGGTDRGGLHRGGDSVGEDRLGEVQYRREHDQEVVASEGGTLVES